MEIMLYFEIEYDLRESSVSLLINTDRRKEKTKLTQKIQRE